MEHGAMAILSLLEAAEQAGTSKVDVWRAIQEGTLPVQRTDDGGFAIDPAELFRVFERQRPEQRPTGLEETASREAFGRPEPDAMLETAATKDIAAAFAALGAELRGLLGQVAGAPANDEQREDKDENRAPRQLNVIADKTAPLREDADTGMRTPNAAADETETSIPMSTKEEVADTPLKRPWWRRLAG
jgi:hypothetical protein